MPLNAPDVEGAVVAALRAAALDCRDVLRPPYPALRAVRVGGTRAVIADTALVQLDCAQDIGGSKSACLARLERAISVLRATEGTTVAGVVIAECMVLGAPMYLPDPLTGAPRYAATLQITSRALVPSSP